MTITIPKVISDTIKGEDILMAGYTINDNFSFEYRNNQFIVKYKKEEKNKEWLYKMTMFFEKLCIKYKK